MKVPWQSSVVFYRTEGSMCVAEREAQVIFTREVADTVSSLSLDDEFRKKLLACPFLVVDDVAISCEGTCEDWENYAVLQSDIAVEEDRVVVNYSAPLTTYELRGNTYEIQSTGSLFCAVMCLPQTFDSVIIPRLQNYREHTIDKQIKSGRIFLGNGNCYMAYSAADFSPLYRSNLMY